MRNLLIVATDFPPQGGSGTVRVAKFVKYLPQFGWLPTVICLNNVWNHDPSLLPDIPTSVNVYRVPLPKPARAVIGQLISRSSKQERSVRPARIRRAARHATALARAIIQPDTLALWVPAAVRCASELLTDHAYDAIFTTSPPHSTQLAGLFLSRRHPGIPWIADYRDPWSESHFVVGRLWHRPNRFLECWCHRQADRVIVVTEGLRRQTKVICPDLGEDKIVTITNGFDPADAVLAADSDTQRPFTISFVGSLYEGRHDTQLIPALTELSRLLTADQLNVRFVGHISPKMLRDLQPLVDSGFATLVPFVPRNQALAEMASADSLLLLESDIPELRLSHSNKLFEYLATGLPILAIAGEGEATALARMASDSIVVHPADKDGIKSAILSLRKIAHRSPRFTQPTNEMLTQYHRQHLTQKLAQVLDDVCEEHS